MLWHMYLYFIKYVSCVVISPVYTLSPAVWVGVKWSPETQKCCFWWLQGIVLNIGKLCLIYRATRDGFLSYMLDVHALLNLVSLLKLPGNILQFESWAYICDLGFMTLSSNTSDRWTPSKCLLCDHLWWFRKCLWQQIHVLVHGRRSGEM